MRAVRAATEAKPAAACAWPSSGPTRSATSFATPPSVHRDLLVQDLRYAAAHAWHRRQGFTLTAILVAALGIGATTAAFSITDHVSLRPLPFPESDRLVRLWQDQPFRGYPRMELSPSNFLDWRRLATSFDGMSAYTSHFRQPGWRGRTGAARRRARHVRGLPCSRRASGAWPGADERRRPRARRRTCRLQRALVAAPNLAANPTSSDERSSSTTAARDRRRHAPGFDFPDRDVGLLGAARSSRSMLSDRDRHVSRRRRPAAETACRSKTRAARCELIAAQLARAYPKENAQTSATRLPPARPVSRAGAHAAHRARRRGGLHAADRVHEPGESAAVARALGGRPSWRSGRRSAPGANG